MDDYEDSLGDAPELAGPAVVYDDGAAEGYGPDDGAYPDGGDEDEAARSGAAPAGYVPLAALLDVREEAKALKERLRGYEAQGPETDGAPEAGPLPGPEAVRFALTNARLDISEDVARSRHGDGMVDAVQDWFAARAAQSPAFRAEVLSHRNPYEYAIDTMRREHALSQIDPDDFAQYQAWRAAMAGQAAGSGAGGVDTHASGGARGAALRAPSPSLASASSAGGVQHMPIGPGRAFDSTFK